MTQSTYTFSGLPLDLLADMAGRTPAYIYSRARINEQIAATKAALPDDIAIHYSIKANPHPHTVSAIASEVHGLDVASHAEMLAAIATGMLRENISFSGPGKSDLELQAAIAAGIVLHVESISELRRITNISVLSGITAKLALRLNPDFTVRQSGMVMGGGSQPFGIDVEEAGQVLQHMRNEGLTCQGLHCYSGSQMLSAERVSELQVKTLDMMLKLVNEHDLHGVSLNIGGGFGVPYFINNVPLNIHEVGKQLDAKLDEIRSDNRICKVIVELGRYLVAESGIYVARIIEKKISRGVTFLVLEGGMNHHLAASGNLGQVIRRNYPVACAPLKPDSTVQTVTIVGPLCTPLDVLASDIVLPTLLPGDLVAVLNSGAYGYSASPHRFLSHPPPVELLV